MSSLVSIIVRSMARDVLTDALESIAQQTWPHIEIVLVAACGSSHPEPPATCGRYPIRFVRGDRPRLRPVAANAGIDAATGDAIGLLDDDDAFDPRHVESMVRALDAHPNNVAAYSATRLIDRTGAVIGHRNQGWSRLLLYQDCYIGSNAMLFRRSALERCRFDESFDICEDWDFWLQLSELSDLVYVPSATAIGRPTEGTSGTGRGENRDDSRYLRFRAMLAAKWDARGRAVATSIATATSAALTLFNARRWADAETAADGVLAAYPFELTALNIKGTLLAMRGDFEAAAAHFRTATAEAPEDPASRLNLAQALDRAGRAGDALAEYARVLAALPGHPQASARRAALERQLAG
jgi:tetratricopeptide (TPR) repeat protein